MTFPNQTALKSAISDLKEVVTRLHAADTEPVRLLGVIETCASEIESKSRIPLVVAAQALVINPTAPPISI
jgi:hypothetical protein